MAMLAFVVDVGQTYLENRNTQQVADSMIRTVNKMLSTGTSNGVLVSEIPDGGTTYISYDDLKNDVTLDLSEDVKKTLTNLMDNIALLASMNGVTVVETFNIDDGNNLYYKVEVSKAYNAIMKIASAAEGDGTSDGSATALSTMIMKFEKANNLVTKGLSGGDDSTYTPAATNLDELKEALSEATTPKEKQEVIESLVNLPENATEEQKEKAINTIETIVGGDKATTPEDKNTKTQVVQTVLDSESSFTNKEKGEIFVSYLISEIPFGESGNKGTMMAVQNMTEVSVSDAAEVLYLALQTQPFVNTSTLTKTQKSSDKIEITYKNLDNGKNYYVTVTKSGNSVTVGYHSEADRH